MAHLDGNVLAGPLSEIFVSDMTMASGCCIGCGDVALVAVSTVEVDRDTFTVRCSACGEILATLIQTADHNRLDLSGLRWISVPRVG